MGYICFWCLGFLGVEMGRVRIDCNLYDIDAPSKKRETKVNRTERLLRTAESMHMLHCMQAESVFDMGYHRSAIGR